MTYKVSFNIRTIRRTGKILGGGPNQHGIGGIFQTLKAEADGSIITTHQKALIVKKSALWCP